MKKYIKPSSLVFTIDAESLLNTLSMNDTNVITPDNQDEFTPLSKRRRYWDEDVEDEENLEDGIW